MGYEITLYFTCGPIKEGTVENPAYNPVIGFVDLCKIGDNELLRFISDRIQETKAIGQKNYFYSDDGDTRITHDRYGDPIAELPPVEMLKLLEEANAKSTHRRYAIAISFLKAAMKGFENSLRIFSYGH